VVVAGQAQARAKGRAQHSLPQPSCFHDIKQGCFAAQQEVFTTTTTTTTASFATAMQQPSS
jgi:hypothetical protein